MNKSPYSTNDIIVGPKEYVNSRAVHYVKNANSGRYFRIGATEEFILRKIEEKLSLDDIKSAFSKEFFQNISDKSLNLILAELTARGVTKRDGDPTFLEEDGVKEYDVSASNFLTIKFYKWHADNAFTRILPYLTFLRSLPAAIALIFIFAASESMVALNLHDLWEVSKNFLNDNDYKRAIVFLTIYSIMLILHEMGHVLALKLFGGQVYEVGFMFRYIYFCAYTKLDDMAFMKNRTDRIWILLSGSLVSSKILLPAFIIFKFTDGSLLIHKYCADLLIWYNLSCILQLIPFLKTDGYFMLTSTLRMPDLAQDALRALIALTPKARARLKETNASRCPPYVHRAALIYGFASVILALFSFLALADFLSAALHNTADLMTEISTLGILLGLLLIAVRAQTRRWRATH